MRKRKAPREQPPRRHPGRKALAYHEAGHAVAGYALGLEIERLDIVPDERSLGHCIYRGWDAPEAVENLDTSLLLLLAGPVAEEIAMDAPSGAADERKALRLAHSAGCSAGEAAGRIAQSRPLIERFLRGHWPVVQALAKALRKERELSGTRTMKTIRRALRMISLNPTRIPRVHGTLQQIGCTDARSDAFPLASRVLDR